MESSRNSSTQRDTQVLIWGLFHISNVVRYTLIVVNQGNAKWQLHGNNVSTQVSSDTYGGYRTVQSSDWDDGVVSVIRRHTFIIL